jgi:hypothetical protein
MMGELHLWISTDWLGLMTTKGTPIVGKFLCKGDTVDVGTTLDFPGYSVKVIQCVHSPHVGRAATVKELMQMSGSDLNPKDQGWHVTYSTHRDLWYGRMKSYDGSLYLSAKHHWLLLKDAKGAMVGRRTLRSSDSFGIGTKISFPNHEIRMGKPWSGSAKVSMTACSSSVPMAADVSLTACSPSMHVTDESIRKNVSLSSLPGSADISKQLDFSYGHKFKTNVRKRLASTVHPLGKSNHFLLVVSFGRANFKLTEDMAAIALESCIGGIAEDLVVQCLHDRVFRFLLLLRQWVLWFMHYGLSLALPLSAIFIYGVMVDLSGTRSSSSGRLNVIRNGSWLARIRKELTRLWLPYVLRRRNLLCQPGRLILLKKGYLSPQKWLTLFVLVILLQPLVQVPQVLRWFLLRI